MFLLKPTDLQYLKQFVSATLLIFSTALLQAQTPQWNWASNAGGDKIEEGSQILCDPSGNVFSWGSFESSSIQFGSFTLNNSSAPGNPRESYYLVKHDPSGNALWATTFPRDMTALRGAGLDAQGNIYLHGDFYNTLTLSGQSITCPIFRPAVFIAKYSPAGNLIWLKQKSRLYPPPQSLSLFLSLKKWDNTHLIATGLSFNDTIDGHYLRNCHWLAKMDTAGNYSSFVQLDTISYAAGNIDIKGIAMDSQRNTYISGNYEGSAYFNAAVWHIDTVAGRGRTQAFLAKFDRNLNFIWSKTTDSWHHSGPYGYVNSIGIAIDPQGNVYQAGGFQADSIAFDNTHTHKFPVSPFSTASGNFLTRYKPDGTIVWDSLFMIHNPNTSNFTAICSDKAGGIYCSGGFSNSFALNNFTAFAGNGNVFVAKFGQDGRALWLQTNVSSKSFIRSMDEDGKGNIYVTGNFMQGNAAFGTNTLIMAPPLQTNPYAGDLFIARIGNCNINGPGIAPNTSQHLCPGGSVTFSSSSVSHNTWCTGDTTATIHVSQAGVYFVYGSDNQGCYAPSPTVAVTMGTVNSAVSVTQGTLTANESTGTYQWIDCQHANQPVGTATAQAFNPDASGSYALVIIQNGCTDTSACYQVVINATLALAQYKNEQPLLSVFPNPATGHVSVILNGTGKQNRLLLTDVLGKKQFEKEVFDDRADLDLTGLANGVYQLILVTGAQQTSHKLVIQR